MSQRQYHGKHCGKTVSRQVDGESKKWIKSYCESAGKDAHLVLVEEKDES